MGRVAERVEFEEEPDWDEDVEPRKCRTCRRVFYVKPGQKVRHCPWCGSAQVHGVETRLGEDPRQVRGEWPRRARRI